MMQDSKDLFAKRLEQLGLKKQVDASVVVVKAQEKLNQVFGKNIESCLKVVSFNKGTLKIATKSSAWANECQGHLLEILDEKIQKIVFVNLDKDFTQDYQE